MKKIPPALFELLGGLTLVIPLIVGVLQGFDIADLLFERVIGTLNWSLWLRGFPHLFFYLSWVLVFLSTVILVRNRDAESLSDQLIYTRYVLYFISGYLLITIFLHWVLNAIFYRDGFVAFTFLLGLSLLLIIIFQSVIDMREYNLGMSRLKKWGKSIRYGLLSLLVLLIMIPTLVPMSGFLSSPPNELPDYGGTLGQFDVTRTRYENPIPSNISNYLLPDNDNNSWYSFVYHPKISNPGRSLPVVLFGHGFSGTDPHDYENTFYQLASQGAVVIYTQYVTNVDLSGPFADSDTTNITSSNALYLRYFMTWNGITHTISQLQAANSPLSGTLNLNYLLLIGHSMGGGMIPYLTTQSVNEGWGNEMLMLSMETPWYMSTHPLTPVDMSTLPAHTIVNIAGSEDDHLVSPCVGMDQYELFRSVLPENNLAYLINPSDDHGYPRLVATHYLVTSRVNDQLTLWGYMKRVSAMTHMLVENSNNNPISTTSYFLGGGDNMISQSYWSDGTPVIPLTFSQDPFGQRGGLNIANDYVDAHTYGPEICIR